MTTRVKKINIKEAIFDIGLSLEFISYFLSTVVFTSDMMNSFISVIHYVSFVVLTMAIILDGKFSNRQLLIFFFTLSYGIINYAMSGMTTIITLVLVAYAARNYEFDKIVKKMLYLRIILILLVLLWVSLGFAVNSVNLRTDIYKASWGFDHPNVFGMHIFAVLISVLYLNRTISLRKVSVLSIGLYVICFIAGARTSLLAFAITFVLILCNKLFKWKEVKSKFMSFWIKNQYLFWLGLSTLVGLLYNSGNKIILAIDLIFSRRLYYFNYYLKNFSFNLFGDSVVYQTEGWNYALQKYIPLLTLDNAYLYYLFAGGLVGCVLYYIYIKKTMTYFILKKDVIGIICAVGFFIVGLAETTAFDVNFNLFLLLACSTKLKML